jgi:putative PIN family toxin of toxin-antitoxin system
MRVVIDTSVVIAALRSGSGASARLLEYVADRKVTMLVSIALYLEYQAFATRDEHLRAAGLSVDEAVDVLRTLAGHCEGVDISYSWRPALRDPADEAVLDAAVAGRANAIITFNVRDFDGVRRGFGIDILRPSELLGRLVT